MILSIAKNAHVRWKSSYQQCKRVEGGYYSLLEYTFEDRQARHLIQRIVGMKEVILEAVLPLADANTIENVRYL